MCTRYISPGLDELNHIWSTFEWNPLNWWSELDEAAQDDGALGSEERSEKEVFPAQPGCMVKIERHPKMGKRFALVAGQFGLIAHWVRPEGVKKMARACYNARTETVHEKPSYRTAWRQMNWCVIPAKAIYEPCYESGRPVPWRIRRADGKPMWIAGIRWAYKQEDGREIETYSMLTINADDHALFRRMHAPDDEKRMVVMLKDEDVEAWLNASTHDEARSFFTQYPADELATEAASDPPRVKKPVAKAKPVQGTLLD